MLLIICAISGTACIFVGDDDDATPFPALSPFPDSLSGSLHSIRDSAASLRELPVYDNVEEGVVSSDTLRAYYGETVSDFDEEEQADLDAYNVVLTLLGVMDEDDDLSQIYGDEFSGLVAGLYVPEDDTLVLVSDTGASLGIEDQIAIAHEYVHSFQDGRYDIEDYGAEYIESDLEEDGYTQYSETINCVMEGDATLADEMYATEIFGPDWQDKLAAETAADPPPEVDIPEFLVRDFYFNYSECLEFIRALHAEGGWEAVNAVYDDPPDTTEQVLHIDKYRDRELANTGPPADLTEQLDGWKLLDSSQFGEFDVYNWAATLTGDFASSQSAAAGWGSGWVRSYRDENDPDRAIVQISLGWDTRDDLIEFLGIYDTMLVALGAQANVVSEGNVRFTAPGQTGVIFLDNQLERIEIRVATDTDALSQATTDLPQFNEE
jgi:hypothetical protein